MLVKMYAICHQKILMLVKMYAICHQKFLMLLKMYATSEIYDVGKNGMICHQKFLMIHNYGSEISDICIQLSLLNSVLICDECDCPWCAFFVRYCKMTLWHCYAPNTMNALKLQ